MWRRRGAAAAQAQRRIHAHRSGFLVQEPDFPLPEIDRAAGGEEGFAGPQLELAQGFGAGCPAEAIELLAVNAEQEADVIQPRTARKTASNSWRRSESGTAR